MKDPVKSTERYSTISEEVVSFLKKQGFKPLYVTNEHQIKIYHYDNSHKIFDAINVLYSNVDKNVNNSISSATSKKPPLTGFSTIGEEVVSFLQGYNISPIYKHKISGVWTYHYENSKKLFTLLAFLYPEFDE